MGLDDWKESFQKLGKASLGGAGGYGSEGNKKIMSEALNAFEEAMSEIWSAEGAELVDVKAEVKDFLDKLVAVPKQARNAVAGGDKDLDRVLPQTDLGRKGRRIWVVTTASLPWMTGTSVNPLLRAAYLTRGRDRGKVTLMLPWIEKADQDRLFPKDKRYDTQEEQERVVRDWLRSASMEEEERSLDIRWYDGRYLETHGSIFPMGDITRLIPDEEADVCIMEEPEHLNWYRATGENWTKKFNHVVGIIHTNYAHYAKNDKEQWGGAVKGPWVKTFNKLMTRAYCDKVIKLSDTLQVFAEDKEVTENVHGVREGFLEVGDEVADTRKFDKGAYFLGKMLWEKGYDRLWDLMQAHRSSGGPDFPIDVYGSGAEEEQIHAKAKQLGLPATFHPATDHATLKEYKVFVNPSVSEVLCTTVAEALAMGKWAVVARHPSNTFFYQFPNCLPFSNQQEFNKAIDKAMSEDPQPMTKEYRYMLSWGAATDRLISASKVTVGEAKARRTELDDLAWEFHHRIGHGATGDQLRKMLQGGRAAMQNAYTKVYMADLPNIKEGGRVEEGEGEVIKGPMTTGELLQQNKGTFKKVEGVKAEKARQ